MPVMDGMSATRAIRQYEQTYNISRCCIIALTGLASNSARLEAWNSGIDHYMTKPVNFKKLAELLSKEKTRRASAENSKRAREVQRLEEFKEEAAASSTEIPPPSKESGPQEEFAPQEESAPQEQAKDVVITAPVEEANLVEMLQREDASSTVTL